MNSINIKLFAWLRISFGFVWLIDAYFKWQPAFLNNFSSYLVEGVQGQTGFVQSWINLWINNVSIDPYFFAVIIAVVETAIAIGLIFGLFTRTTIVVGGILSFVIWSTAEGFGGPYVSGATDIGAAIIYIFVFVSLWIGQSWEYCSIDSRFSLFKKR